jgi:hypothetical protein
VADDLSVLTARPGWTVVEDLAIFRPDPDGWYARVARMQRPGRAVDRYHIALISPAGVALYVQFASMVGEARRVAEGWVHGKQGGGTA